MNFQEKLLEASAELRTRAAALATRANLVRRVEDLKKSIAVLDGASREFGKVARRHAGQFVKQNSTIASAVRKDVSALARSTFASLSTRPAVRTRPAARKTRRAPTARKRSAKAA
jgi:hypothetical protein